MTTAENIAYYVEGVAAFRNFWKVKIPREAVQLANVAKEASSECEELKGFVSFTYLYDKRMNEILGRVRYN